MLALIFEDFTLFGYMLLSLLAKFKTYKMMRKHSIAHDSHARQDRTGMQLDGKAGEEDLQLIFFA